MRGDTGPLWVESEWQLSFGWHGKQTGWITPQRGEWLESVYPELWEQGPEKSHAHSQYLLDL